MRIAYIINSVEGGGAAFPVPAVTRVLRDAGAHVEVFALTRRDGLALPTMQADGLQVHLREGGDVDHRAASRWLDRELAAYRPTLLWTSLTRATVIGLLLGWRRAIPVACWQHNEFLERGNLLLLQALRKRPVLWIGDSQRVSTVTAERFGAAPDRVACWPLFIADPEAPQARPWQPGQTLRLGSIGRLQPAKGYDVLVDALALLTRRGFVAPAPFEVAIAGGGARAAIVGHAQRAGVSGLRLVGFCERPRDFLAGLHLYLQPSRREGLCIAMHEAMQAGLPVIASAVGQMAFTLETGRSGWLVPPGNVDALADALADALSDPARLAAMGEAARARVLPLFSPDAFREAGRAVLRRLREHGVRGAT